MLCALSGGVDSAVAALLVHKAVGDQLTCVFVDHGLLRKDEALQVVETFERHFHVPLVHVDAEERFLSRLAGVDDPEQKRKIIGEEFIRVFEEEARKLGEVPFLVQGTLYSDVIESGGSDGVAETIKSHHNVGGLPEDVDFELVEPLRMLFKDEVRRVGEELGLPEAMVWRQPFPGPGLAIRIIGDVTRERLDIVREADAILQEEVRRAGLYRDLWQCFCVLPAIRSVGVQGDARTYAYPIVIRAVTSEDAMTADWARLPYDLLETISSRIINEIPEVNRVCLDLSSKPPGDDRVGIARSEATRSGRAEGARPRRLSARSARIPALGRSDRGAHRWVGELLPPARDALLPARAAAVALADLPGAVEPLLDVATAEPERDSSDRGLPGLEVVARAPAERVPAPAGLGLAERRLEAGDRDEEQRVDAVLLALLDERLAVTLEGRVELRENAVDRLRLDGAGGRRADEGRRKSDGEHRAE